MIEGAPQDRFRPIFPPFFYVFKRRPVEMTEEGLDGTRQLVGSEK
jgi:hypothetical protein